MDTVTQVPLTFFKDALELVILAEHFATKFLGNPLDLLEVMDKVIRAYPSLANTAFSPHWLQLVYVHNQNY